jgi:hypothetical protein
LVSAALLAGCGSPDASVSGDGPNSGGFANSSEADRDYADELQGFEQPFPEGTVLPAQLPGERTQGETFEEGFGESAAAVYWKCAWEAELIRATDEDDKARAEEALDRVAQFVELEAYGKYFVDPEKLWWTHVVEPALKGDQTELRTEYNNGCDHHAELNR